jgi:hypothetical protein
MSERERERENGRNARGILDGQGVETGRDGSGGLSRDGGPRR